MKGLLAITLSLLVGCASLATFKDPDATPMDHACNAAKMAVPFMVMGEQEVTKPDEREILKAVRGSLEGFVTYCAGRNE